MEGSNFMWYFAQDDHGLPADLSTRKRYRISVHPDSQPNVNSNRIGIHCEPGQMYVKPCVCFANVVSGGTCLKVACYQFRVSINVSGCD